MRGLVLLVLMCTACSGAKPGQNGESARKVVADIEISQARLRQPLPGTDKSVGYFELQNHTDGTMVLSGASSPAIGAIEMHETAEVDGLMRMRRLSEVRIEAGERVVFAPGGKHLMLFRLTELPATVPVTLLFESRPPLVVEFQTFSLGEVTSLK
ncbi:MAG: copper chaperone PCu(A)C [Pseudomonadales bacterium]